MQDDIYCEDLVIQLKAEMTKDTDTFQNSDFSNAFSFFYLSEKFHFQNYLVKEYEEIHWTEWILGLFWLSAIEILGNVCLFATIVYERFGMDPQKRTVINQLLSQCCWIVMFHNITTFPALIFRRLLGEFFFYI